MLQVKKLTESSKLPYRSSELSAGYDLYASEETTIKQGHRGLVPLGIAIAVPTGTYGRIAPRSGIAVKHGIDVGAGVVDADYRGQVMVLVFNHGEADYTINTGDRIAQLILERIETPAVCEVNELQNTTRDTSGWGSTGI